MNAENSAEIAQVCWRSECRVTCYYPEACSELRPSNPPVAQDGAS